LVAASAQRQGGLPIGRRTDLSVHVVLPNDRPLDSQVQVQLLSAGNTPLGEQFTSGMGEVKFPGLAPGRYLLRVSGTMIEDSVSEFEVIGEGFQTEYVYVKLLASKPAAASRQGTVSAQTLNVTEKARKELEKGNEEVRRQQWAAAELHFRRAIEAYPDYAAAYNNLGVVCMQTKDYACARDGWEKAVQLDSGNAQAFFNLARLRTAEGNFESAEALLQKSLAIDPTNSEGLLLLGNTELMLGKFDLALLYARKVDTVSHQGAPVAHLIAGNALEGQKKFEEAAAEYRALLQEAPNDPAAARAQEALARLHQTGAVTQQ